MNKKWKEIGVEEADALYVLGIPLQYKYGGVWDNDNYCYKHNPMEFPSRCPTSYGWRVEVDE